MSSTVLSSVGCSVALATLSAAAIPNKVTMWAVNKGVIAPLSSWTFIWTLSTGAGQTEKQEEEVSMR